MVRCPVRLALTQGSAKGLCAITVRWRMGGDIGIRSRRAGRGKECSRTVLRRKVRDIERFAGMGRFNAEMQRGKRGERLV